MQTTTCPIPIRSLLPRLLRKTTGFEWWELNSLQSLTAKQDSLRSYEGLGNPDHHIADAPQLLACGLPTMTGAMQWTNGRRIGALHPIRVDSCISMSPQRDGEVSTMHEMLGFRGQVVAQFEAK